VPSGATRIGDPIIAGGSRRLDESISTTQRLRSGPNVMSTTFVKPVSNGTGPEGPIRQTVEPPTGNGKFVGWPT
jgi:hypothetical protein